jgi:hypothetical protein
MGPRHFGQTSTSIENTRRRSSAQGSTLLHERPAPGSESAGRSTEAGAGEAAEGGPDVVGGVAVEGGGRAEGPGCFVQSSRSARRSQTSSPLSDSFLTRVSASPRAKTWRWPRIEALESTSPYCTRRSSARCFSWPYHLALGELAQELAVGADGLLALRRKLQPQLRGLQIRAPLAAGGEQQPEVIDHAERQGHAAAVQVVVPGRSARQRHRVGKREQRRRSPLAPVQTWPQTVRSAMSPSELQTRRPWSAGRTRRTASSSRTVAAPTSPSRTSTTRSTRPSRRRPGRSSSVAEGAALAKRRQLPAQFACWHRG